jgi:hypothetical protein
MHRCNICRSSVPASSLAPTTALRTIAGADAPPVCSLSCASAWLARRDGQPLGTHVGTQGYGCGYMVAELSAVTA